MYVYAATANKHLWTREQNYWPGDHQLPGTISEGTGDVEYLFDVQRPILWAHTEYLYDLQENLFAFYIGLRIFLP